MLLSVLFFVLLPSCSCLSVQQRVQASKTEGHEDFQKMTGDGLDVVIPVRKPSCVVEKAIKQINVHIAPRRILLVTNSAHCPELLQIAGNVKCLDEDQALLNTTKASIAQQLDVIRSRNDTRIETGWGGHSVAGWYLQQFIKLGISDSPLLQGRDRLSQIYMVIDSDLIPLTNLYVLDEENRMPLMQGGDKPGNLKSNDSEEMSGCPYGYAYHELTGQSILNAPTRGYVPHHMVFHQTYLKEMLTAFGDNWMDMVLRVACGPDRTTVSCSCGFSEYASYGSWMKRYHADRIYDVPESFIRYHDKKSCCLTPDIEQKSINKGLKAIVFEQGQC